MSEYLCDDCYVWRVSGKVNHTYTTNYELEANLRRIGTLKVTLRSSLMTESHPCKLCRAKITGNAFKVVE